MERHFHEELGILKDTLVTMAGLAESMIDDSVRMLEARDPAAAPSLKEREAKVNQLQCEVDDLCTRLIALHQPTASDLRFIIGCIKTNTDLERMADEAVNVSHKIARLVGGEPMDGDALITQMGKIACAMVREGIKVFVSGSSLEARELIARDRELNALKKEVSTRMAALIRGSAESAPRALDLILASRNLERIGDHVKNVAENTIFIREGKDVRHSFSDAESADPVDAD